MLLSLNFFGWSLLFDSKIASINSYYAYISYTLRTYDIDIQVFLYLEVLQGLRMITTSVILVVGLIMLLRFLYYWQGIKVHHDISM